MPEVQAGTSDGGLRRVGRIEPPRQQLRASWRDDAQIGIVDQTDGPIAYHRVHVDHRHTFFGGRYGEHVAWQFGQVIGGQGSTNSMAIWCASSSVASANCNWETALL